MALQVEGGLEDLVADARRRCEVRCVSLPAKPDWQCLVLCVRAVQLVLMPWDEPVNADIAVAAEAEALAEASGKAPNR